MSDQPRPDPSPPGDERPSHPSLAAELSATAHRVEHVVEELGDTARRVEHAVEETLEHGIEVAEQTIVRRYGLGALRAVRATLRFAFWSLVAAYFAFGALLLVTRYYVLPRIDQWRPQIEAIASRALNGTVTMDRIQAGWRGFNPHLSLDDVLVTGPRGGPPLALPRVDATVSWLSLATMAPRFVALRLLAPEVSIARRADGSFTVAGFVIEPGKSESEGSPALDWLLAQDRVVVRDGHVVYHDERGAEPLHFELNDVSVLVEQSLGSHTFALQALPTAEFAGPIDIRGSVRTGAFARSSEAGRWTGQVFTQLDFVDLALLSRLVPVPVEIEQAYGAVRVWLGFDEGEVVRTTADVAMQDVAARLAKDLEPLRLASLQGRVTQRRWGDTWPAGRGGQEFGLAGTTFVTADGLTFPAMDVKVRRTRAAGKEAQRTTLEASRIDLESLSAVLAHLPLPADLRDNVARHALRGTLAGLSLAWSGEATAASDVALSTRFSGLASAAQPPAVDAVSKVGLPGFDNLGGAVRFEQGAGTLELASADATLEFPGVFEDPRLPLKQLAGTVHWRQGATLEVRAEGLRVSNDDIDASVTGTYRREASGPGAVELSGRVVRANAETVHRYVPSAVGAGVRNWLQHALVRGRLSDASFRLRGDLARFPFTNPADGDFRVAGRVSDATLDVYPAAMSDASKPAEPGAIWPVLSEIDADLVFERASMTITAQRGRAYGARIEQANARIPHLGRDTTLEVKGRVQGPLADLLRYADASPVGKWIGGIAHGAEATGSARLDLGLVIPLAHAADARVNGAIAFQNNNVTLAGLPPFTRISGTLNFNERGVRIDSLSTDLLGGAARLDASTRADGAVVINAGGTATPAGLRGALPFAPVQRLLDKSSGSARYRASVVVKDGAELRVDSDLVGFAIDGIAPLRKSAAESLPTRIEWIARATSDDLQVQLGRALGVRLERRAQEARGELRLARGVIALNEAANLPESGLLVIASLPRLDVDAWFDLLAPDAPPRGARPPPADDGLRVDLVALRTEELVVQGQRVHNLTLGATRQPDGSYAANVVSDGATGYIGWRPDTDPQSLGQISARLSRLVISSRKEDEVVAVLRTPPKQIPSLEVRVEQFELSGMKLGQLDLVAQNIGSGASASWRMRRLDLTNPDMKFASTGEWSPAPGGGRRMQLKFSIDATDGGAALARIGYPAALSRGTGRIEGDVQWLGSPLDIDYPTLAGRVNVAIDDGRFLKVDPGNAARLLALLSLQSLGRTLAQDGGSQFAEGFAFTSIRADATIDRGILKTDNFRMSGASAAVLMSGALDLRNETQQLSIVVLPVIDASTAALAVGVVNPVLGLGTFLAQLMLKDPLSRAFAIQYDVTGPWANPSITRQTRITPPQSNEAAK